MSTIKHFTDIDVWGKARTLENKIYLLTNKGLLAKDFESLFDDCNEISKMITGFVEYLNKSHYKGQKFKDRT